MPTTMKAADAHKLILSGEAPENLHVTGHLDLSKELNLKALPDGLEVTRLTIRGCWGLKQLPKRLRCFELDASETLLTEIPADLRVQNRLDLSNCADLVRLPENLRVGTLELKGCTKLASLPEGLDVCFLDVSGCIALNAWPERADLRIGRLTARDCTGLTHLPSYLTQLAQLDLSGCESISELPEGLRISSWLDIAGTDITEIPLSLRGVRLRWRGVLVDERIVFRPETITGTEVLATANAEVRRVMMERMGMERFFEDVKAEVLDTDHDPGGVRQLLRVPLPSDEDLVCLAVACPSTGRNYVLRVPPTVRYCTQAAAWIAGFDNADEYAPLAET
jgi:hypothetical protein